MYTTRFIYAIRYYITFLILVQSRLGGCILFDTSAGRRQVQATATGHQGRPSLALSALSNLFAASGDGVGSYKER